MDVGLDVLGWKEHDGVSEVSQLSCPVMSHPAGFHTTSAISRWGEQGKKPRAAQAMSFRHPARAVRDSELKDVLCNIHGNRRMLHFRTPPSFQNVGNVDSGTSMPTQYGRSSYPQIEGRIERTIGANNSVRESRGMAQLAMHPRRRSLLGVVVGAA